MKIEDFYKAQLQSFYGVTVTEDAFVSLDDGTGTIPLTIDGRRLVIPTRERLQNGITADQVAYHPLCEAVIRTTSPVLKKITQLAGFTASIGIMRLLERLLEIAVTVNNDVKCKNVTIKLSVDQSEIMNAVPDGSKTLIADFETIREEAGPFSDLSPMRWYMRKAGQWKGNTYSHVAVSISALYDELNDDENNLIKTKKNRKAIVNMLRWMLPELANEDGYSFGSNSHVATRYHALMCAFVSVARRLNEINTLFENIFAKLYGDAYSLEDDLIDISWESELDNFRAYIDLIPPHPGNISGEDFTDVNAQVAGQVNQQPRRPQNVNPQTNINNAVEKPRPRTLADFAPNAGMMPAYPGSAMTGVTNTPMMMNNQGQYPNIGVGQFNQMYPNNQGTMMYPNNQGGMMYPNNNMNTMVQPINVGQVNQAGYAGILQNGQRVWVYPNGAMVPLESVIGYQGPVSYGSPAG